MGAPMSAWEIDQQERKAKARADHVAMVKYAKQIAGALGDGWAVVPQPGLEDRLPHVVHADGYGFYLSSGGFREVGRVSVGPLWPKGADGREAYPHFSKYSGNGETSPGITFARTKSAVQGARDIARRFLPDYLPIWQREADRQRGIIDARVSRRALAGDAAEIVGGTVADDRDGNAVVKLWRAEYGTPEYDAPGISDLVLGSDGEITIKVRGNLETLRAIQGAISAAKGGR